MQIHEADKNFIVYKAEEGRYNYHNYTEFLLEGFFDVTWEGEMRAITLATNLENKEHTISIELIDEHNEKATGEKFMLTYLFLAE